MVDVDLSSLWKSIADDNDTGPIGDVPASHSFYRKNTQFAFDVAETIKGHHDRREVPGRSNHTQEDGRLIIAGSLF